MRVCSRDTSSCPSLADHEANRLAPGQEKGGEAPKGAMPTIAAHTSRCRHLPMLEARLRATVEGAPAFRRYAAALATGYRPDG